MNLVRVRSSLERVHGLDLAVAEHPGVGKRGIQVWPFDLHRNEGFYVEIEIGWRSISGSLRPGSFANDMLRAMGEGSLECRGIASAFLRAAGDRGYSVALSINGLDASPGSPETWPEGGWKALDVSTRRGELVPEELTDDEVENVVTEAATMLLGFALAVAPTQELYRERSDEGLPEGARTSVTLNRYERSRINRAACLATHGFECQACGTELSSRYGSVADKLIHVHHVVPISRLGPDYRINPVRDLVPLCPNCHAVVHRKDPPYSIAEVRGFLDDGTPGNPG